MRHGPIDMIQVKDKRDGKGEAPAKTCPKCLAIIHAAYQCCPDCGFEFPPPEKGKHYASASSDAILSGQTESAEHDVYSTYYSVHSKRGAANGTPQTMRVDYQIGFNEYCSEWVCPEHTGYAREKFMKWWRERTVTEVPIPKTAHEAVALANGGLLAEPKQITVKTTSGESFKRICNHALGEVPAFNPETVEMIQYEQQSEQPFDDDGDIPF